MLKKTRPFNNTRLPLLLITSMLGGWAVAGDISELKRCWTPSLTSGQLAQTHSVDKSISLLTLPFPAQGVKIPVAFHVITGQDKNGQSIGDVDDKMLDNQIAVLNKAFIGSGFSFKLSSIDRTANNTWFNCAPKSTQDHDMKQALAINPAKTFNVYTCNTRFAGYISWSTYPFLHPENSPAHGIVMLYDTLPGGIAKPYDLGDVAVHETGHYLGLLHTFEHGCQMPGDGVEDTAYEKEPNFGCNQSTDSCKGFIGKNSGKDPIFNYMDFTTDACMREFSRGQIERMQAIVSLFKPTLIQ